MIFRVIADTHFGHGKMQEYCGRPDGFEGQILGNMHEQSMAVMRSGKSPAVIVHLGDFCIGEDVFWHAQFMDRCFSMKRWLVRGNHDKKSHGWYLDHGWDAVADRFDLYVFGKRLSFSHRPLPDNGSFDLNIHGHLHNSEHHPECAVGQRHRLITIEHTYAPVDLKKIVQGKA